jgi:hypothetical protein
MLEACEMQVLMNDYAEHLGQKKKMLNFVQVERVHYVPVCSSP